MFRLTDLQFQKEDLIPFSHNLQWPHLPIARNDHWHSPSVTLQELDLLLFPIKPYIISG